MSGRSDIEEAAVKSLRKYGVGSCGPRGFYGTVDVHLKLEDKLQEFMRCEEAIIYSYGFATIASAIPAYSKRGDIIFADEGVHFAIQKGIQASRSKVVYFKHNDMEDLERVLKLQQVEDRKNPKKAKVTRRFMVIEGLYMNYGDICPLPRLVELKHQYKVRIFMDETISFGTLGATGRGVTEHFNVPIEEIDLIAASLENSLASVGGFCCGRAYVIDHQRLSGLGYCFSASAPPMLAQAAISALEVLENSPELLVKLEDISKYAHSKLSTVKFFKLSEVAVSPIIHLRLASPSGNREKDLKTLRNIVELAEAKGVALTVAAYLDDEIHPVPPSIRVAINCELTHEEVDKVVAVLDEVVNNI
jgi:serine palmitoyltransferase